MKFDKFKFSETNDTKCRTNGCNNYPEDSYGIYCAMCKAQQGM